MDQYEEKLKHYMQKHDIQGEHMSLDQSCHTVEEAAEAINAPIDEIVKDICLIDSEGNLILAIVMGKDRASTKRIANALGIERPRTATPEEMLEKTGYPCGGIPSFGFKAKYLIDPKVMEKEHIYTSGGSEKSMLKISTKELLKANNGEIVRIRK